MWFGGFHSAVLRGARRPLLPVISPHTPASRHTVRTWRAMSLEPSFPHLAQGRRIRRGDAPGVQATSLAGTPPAPPQERCALDSSVFAIARPFRLPTWRRLGRRLLRPQRFPRGGRAGRYPNLRSHMRIVRPSKTGGGTTFRTARFLAHAKFFYPALPLASCECGRRRYLAMYQVSRRCKHRR